MKPSNSRKVYRLLLFSVSANISGVRFIRSSNHSHGKCVHISTFCTTFWYFILILPILSYLPSATKTNTNPNSTAEHKQHDNDKIVHDFWYFSWISFVDINNGCVTNDDGIQLTSKMVALTSLRNTLKFFFEKKERELLLCASCE